MKLNDKLYDVLKWITMIVLPALATAYVGLAAVWGWPFADEIAKTVAVVCTLLGALLGISTAEYNRSPDYLGKHVALDPVSVQRDWDDLGKTLGNDQTEEI